MTAPSLHDRLAVHRCVEYMRGHDAWPEEGEDLLAFALTLGLPIPPTEGGRRLLQEELGKLAARRESLGVDADLERYHAWLQEHPEAPPVDPFGELAGGRVGCQALLCRLVDSSVGEG